MTNKTIRKDKIQKTIRIEAELVKKSMTLYPKGTSFTDVIRNLINEAFSVNKYEFLDDGCKMREYLTEEESPKGKQYGEGFYCLKNAPKLIKLGSGIESVASKICSKCIIREELLEDSKTLKKLEKKGIKTPTLTNLIPLCKRGGYLFDNGKMMSCPIALGNRRPILQKDRKKKDITPCTSADNGNQCESLTWIPEKEYPKKYLNKNR